MSATTSKYNHVFNISFSLENESPQGETTNAELYQAIMRRLITLTAQANPRIENLVEACGTPEDTYKCDGE